MKMDLTAGSGFDEFYTPPYAVYPILKYIKPNSTIWCPFDTEDSYFVKIFKRKGYRVFHSHICNGEDFFSMKVCECDYIISNPPYSVKGDVFKKLFEIGKPFAMLVGVSGLFESKKRFDMFRANKFEIMYFDKRVSYMRDYGETNTTLNPPFSSVYLCHNVLPKQIVFENLNKEKQLSFFDL